MIRPATLTENALTPFARDVLRGLMRTPKAIPSTYFYDQRGSELFEQITQLEEYYLTRCEREILERHGSALASLFPRRPYRLIELGAGDGHKTHILLQHLLEHGHAIEYVPIDICASSVEKLVASTRQMFRAARLTVQGIAADSLAGLMSLRMLPSIPKVVLFLGSSIGNMTRRQAANFLTEVRLSLRPGDQMLIGFDLKKPVETLQAAYDDRQGVTREFNFNLLDRINRELDGEFERRAFTHYARYHFAIDAMESWLVSNCEQSVGLGRLGRRAQFAAGEGMLVERSHKYERDGIERFAARTGFAVRRHFVDRRGYFVDSLWQAAHLPSAAR